MATIITRGGEGYSIDHSNGSGLNFFGAQGAGYSIAVNDYNSRTYIGNANGTIQGAEIDNNKWINATGVCYGVSGTEYLITQLPQDKATINISFHHDTAVDVQNFEIRGVYDENNIDTAPSGSGNYWSVFEIDTSGNIIPINTVTDFVDTSEYYSY